MHKEVFVITHMFKNLDHGLKSAFIDEYCSIPEDTKVDDRYLDLTLALPEIKNDSLRQEKVKIFYQVLSRAENKKWMLFINGFTSSVNLWKFQKGEFLRQGYNLVVFDLLGQGNSSKPVGVKYVMSAQLKVIEALVDASGLGKQKYVLTGISAGGMIAQMYAKEHQQDLSALVLLATTPKVDGSLEFLNEARLAILNNPNLGEGDKKKLMSNYLMLHIFSDNFIRQYRPVIDQLMVDSATRNTVDSIIGDLYSQENFDSTLFLSEIKIPVLIFSGMHDKIVETHATYTLNQLLPNSQRFIFKGVNASHTFVLELFETFNKTLLSELAKLNSFNGSKTPIFIDNQYIQEKPAGETMEIHL